MNEMLLCSANAETEVSSELLPLLETYSTASKRPFDRWIDFPQLYRTFVDPISGALYQSVLLFAKTARWRYNIAGDHIPLTSPSFQWSKDGETWQPLMIDIRIAMTTGWTWKFNFTATSIREIETVMRRGEQEPVYHELLREARSQRRGNERSGLVLAVAAVEWGIKHLIAKLVPDAEWLVFDVPAPPVVRMLTEYLPKLPVKQRFGNGEVKSPPDDLLQRLRTAIRKRDEVVHGKREEVDAQEVLDAIDTARDLLYMFDYYQGIEWAADHLSFETCQELGIEYKGVPARVDITPIGDTSFGVHLVTDLTTEKPRRRKRKPKQGTNRPSGS